MWLLVMSLKWNVDDVGNALTMHVVYVRGGWSAVTMSDGPFMGDKRG